MALPYDTVFRTPDPQLEESITGAPTLPPGDPLLAELEERIAREASLSPVDPLPPPAPIVDPALEAEILGQYQPAPVVEPPPSDPTEGFGTAFKTFSEPDKPAAFSADVAPGEEVSGFQAPEESYSLGVDNVELKPEDPANALAEPEFYDESMVAAEIAPQDVNDEALQMSHFDDQQAEQEEKDRLQREAASADAKLKLRNAQVHEKKQDEIEAKMQEVFAKAKEVGSMRIDNGRYAERLGIGGRLASALAIIAGGQLGILSGRGGNDALDFFLGEINRDVEEQRYNIELAKGELGEQKGLVAEMYKAAGNSHQAAEMARLALYESAISQIDSGAARLDPEGSQAIEREMQKRRLQAASAAQRAKIADDMRRAGIEEAKFELERMDTLSQIAEREQKTLKLGEEIAKLKRRGTGGGARKQPPGYWEALYGPEGRPPVAMSPKEHSAWLTTRGKVARLSPKADAKEQAEASRAEAEAVKAKREADADDTAVRNPRTGGKLEHKGEVWRTKHSGEVADRMAQTQIARRVVDKIKILKKEAGGSNKWTETEEFSEIQALVSKLDMDNAVALGLGAISKDDLVQLVNFRGGVDPTSYVLNAVKGLETMAVNMEETTNTYMRSKGWKGKPWKPVRIKKAKAHERSDSELFGAITAAPASIMSPEEALEDKQANIDVFLRRKPTAKQISKMAAELTRDVGSSMGSDAARGLILRMWPAYKEAKYKEKRIMGAPGAEEHIDGLRDPQIDDEDFSYQRILGGH